MTGRPSALGPAALIHTVSRYAEQTIGVSLIEVQKLLYFLQEAGEPLRLRYVKGTYGPYADNLRHVLRDMEGHYLVGYGDGSAAVREAEPIRLLPGAVDFAAPTLDKHPETARLIDRVLDLADGFESAYSMELLATVHWLTTHASGYGATDLATVKTLVRTWSSRKARMFTDRHLAIAWDHLGDRGWVGK